MTKTTNQPEQRPLVGILLLLIIIVGGALRLYNPLWDLGTFPHPDERSTLQFYAPTIRLPADPADLLDPRRSTLNPFWDVRGQSRRSYTYGHFPLYSLVLAGAFLHSLAPWFESINAPPGLLDFLQAATTDKGYAVIGRTMVALLDVLSIYLVFLIARRLYGSWAGLLAAAFSAFAVLHIQLAHFFAVDPISTTFVLLAIYGSILIYDRRTAGAALLTGLAIGLAVSSKYSALPVVLAPAMAGLLIIRDSQDRTTTGLATAVRLVGIAALTSFLTFALTSPFVLLDFANFRIAVIKEQGDMVSGVADLPFTRQYRNTPAYLYFIEQQVKWGLGWPLGLLAFAGFGWALGRGLWSRLQPGEWIVLAWLVPYFGLNGLFLAKFMRYMSPVTPLIIVLGAGLLIQGGRRLAERWPWARYAVAGVAAIILLTTAIWALAFVNGVYASEHSWVTTSRWIYDNVPAGSCIAREHWEENVPVDWAWLEPDMSLYAHNYFQPQLPMYDPDTESKYEFIRDTLNNCDYLVIASNRMLRTLPRLAERYPFSTRYYEALFNGELGYELVYQHATPPRLGPLVIDTQPADESFTVYDHPKAFVFKKTRQLSNEEWDAILGGSWQGAVHGYIGRPTLLMRLRGVTQTPGLGNADQAVEPAKTTWLARPLSQWPVVDDWHWNTLVRDRPWLAALIWWLAVQVVGLAAFPLTFLLCKGLADRGYLLSKSLGLLLISYATWLPAGLGWPANRLGVILVWLAVLILLGGFLAYRRRGSLRNWWTEHKRLMLVGEAVFTLVFILFVLFRAINPDLWQPWQGGEKMLEIGFLHAIVKSAYMPPYDPFFAGAFINYYYYGLYIVGVLIKLTGIEPVVGFNLAVAMLAALTAANVFSLAGNLAHRWGDSSLSRGIVAGLLGVLFVVFFSNLDGMGQFLRNLAEASTIDFSSAIPGLQTLVHAGSGFLNALGGFPIREFNYWDTSRVIPFTINEFPYWSFLFADLHPHMIGIPFTILFLSLVYAWLKSSGETPLATETQRTTELPSPALAAVVGPGTFAMEVADAVSGERPYQRTADAERQPSFWEELWLVLRQERQALLIGSTAHRFWLWVSLPFVLGALSVINTWDLPTYLGLSLAAFALARYRAGLRPLTLARSLVLLLETVLFGAVLLAATLLLYAPFFASYSTPSDVSGAGLVKDKVPLDAFLKIWGFFFFVLGSWLLVRAAQPVTRFAPLRSLGLFLRRWNVFPHLLEIYGKLVKRTDSGYRLTLLAVVLILFLTLALILLRLYTVGVLLPWLLIAFLLLLRWDRPVEESLINLLVFTGLLVLLGVQIFFVKDHLGGGEWYRMNTFFKFFIQVWGMFGVAAAVVLPRLWGRSEVWPAGRRILWQGVLMILIFSSLVFLVLGTRQRLGDRFPGARPEGLTLDGSRYMTVGEFSWNNVTYQLRYDYQAINWLRENVLGTPIIAEAKLGYYREGGMRVAAYTGLPSVLGGLHQNEQHPPQQVGRRDGQVSQFWLESDPNRFMELAKELNVTYIYFGQLERAFYGDYQLEKFETLVGQGRLTVVFQNEKTVIYRVVD